MSFDLVLKNGLVALGQGAVKADIAIDGERIVSIAQPGSLASGTQSVDVDGKYVVPGGIDPHVHSATGRRFATVDGFEGATLAAAWGGTTTIVDFAIPGREEAAHPLSYALERMADAAGKVAIDVAFHGAIGGSAEGAVEIPQLAEHGLTTIKIFTIYEGMKLSLSDVHTCMRAVADVGGVLLVHTESPHIVEPLRAQFAAEGKTDASHHALSRPIEAELDTARAVLELFRLTKCAGYIVHVTAPAVAAEISRARIERGVHVWAETCPQYVFLDDSKYAGPDGDLYICSPPIRPRAIAAELWAMVQAGAIQVWASDHSCYSVEQKFTYRGDFTKIPNGLPGVELRAPLLFSEGVMTGRIGLAQFAALTATNAAKLNGLFPRKGVIAPGSDADLAIYNPSVEFDVEASRLHMPAGYSPFEGMHIRGWPETVISRGRVLIENSKFVGDLHGGVVLPASKPTMI